MESRARLQEVILKPKAPPAALLQAAMVAKHAVRHGHNQVTLYEDRIAVRDTTTDESLPRRYTLVPSERTAEMSLSIGRDYDEALLNRSQPGRVRDELLAELTDGEAPRLKVTCVAGSAERRDRWAEPGRPRKLFEQELPFALAVIRYGDRFFFERHPELDRAPVLVEFRTMEPEAGTEEEYGRITDYRVTRIAGESRRVMVGAAALAALGIGALVVGTAKRQGRKG
jgi:hypothetical protein